MAYRHSVIDHPAQLFGVAVMATIVGALSAIMFSSKQGKQTRQEIRDRVADLRTKMRQPKDDMKATFDTTFDNLTEIVRPTRGRSKGSTMRKVYDDAELTKKELSDDLHDETDHIRKHGER